MTCDNCGRKRGVCAKPGCPLSPTRREQVCELCGCGCRGAKPVCVCDTDGATCHAEEHGVAAAKGKRKGSHDDATVQRRINKAAKAQATASPGSGSAAARRDTETQHERQSERQKWEGREGVRDGRCGSTSTRGRPDPGRAGAQGQHAVHVERRQASRGDLASMPRACCRSTGPFLAPWFARARAAGRSRSLF